MELHNANKNAMIPFRALIYIDKDGKTHKSHIITKRVPKVYESYRHIL